MASHNSHLQTNISGYIVGCSYAFLWYGSILLGFYFLYAPCLLILPFSRSLYRRVTDTLYSSWEAFNVVSISVSRPYYTSGSYCYFLFRLCFSHSTECG